MKFFGLFGRKIDNEEKAARLFELGQEAEREGYFPKASEYYRNALKANENPSTRDAILRVDRLAYIRKTAWELYQAGKHHESLAYFEELAATSTSEEAKRDARMLVAMLYEGSRRYQDAMRELNALVQENPNNHEIVGQLGYFMCRRGNIKQGILCLEEAAKHIHEAMTLAANRGTVGAAYYIIGEHNLAMQCWQQAAKLNSKLAEAYYSLGILYARKGNKTQSLKEFKKAVALNSRMERKISLLITGLESIGNSRAKEMEFEEIMKNLVAEEWGLLMG